MFDNKEKDKQVKVESIDYIVNNYEGGRTNINRVDYKVKRKQNIIETLKIKIKNKIENEGKIKGNRTKDKGNKE